MIYRVLTEALRPFVPLYLIWRGWRGKEDKGRMAERYGRASRPRPLGVLCWLHAASVGESVSALVLAAAMLKQRPAATILITSGTPASAALIKERGKAIDGAILHQYVPLDITAWGGRFLDHWRPDLGVMVEGDLWPGLIAAAGKRGIPLAMASVQISDASLRFWGGYGKRLGRRILPHFEAVFAVDETHAERLGRLPFRPGSVEVGGSFKMAAPPLAEDEATTARLNALADGRRIILLASSHEGEEALFLDTLESLTPGQIGGQILAVIAPRHPRRATAIMRLMAGRGIPCRQWSRNGWPEPGDTLWLADRMGAMGGLIRAADIIVLGGGFAPLGGHNPLEMAALGKGVISGRHVFKNAAAFDMLTERNGVIFCDDSASLAEALDMLMASPARLERLNTGAFKCWKALAHDAAGRADEVAARLLSLAPREAHND